MDIFYALWLCMICDGTLRGFQCVSFDVYDKGFRGLRSNCPLEGWLEDITLIWDAQRNLKPSKH